MTGLFLVHVAGSGRLRLAVLMEDRLQMKWKEAEGTSNVYKVLVKPLTGKCAEDSEHFYGRTLGLLHISQNSLASTGVPNLVPTRAPSLQSSYVLLNYHV